MVSKKTSDEDVKKAPAAKPATTAKKTSPAKTAAAKSAPVKTLGKAENKNFDVVGEVLEIKAKNDEKQQEKAAKKAISTASSLSKAATAKKTTSVASTETAAKSPAKNVSAGEGKGSKALPDKSKRTAVKANAQKAEAMKFIAQKEDDTAQACDVDGCDCATPCGCILFSWARAYKNMFNFKGRTSRYEFWSFMLLNFVLAAFAAAGIWYSTLQGAAIGPVFLTGLAVFAIAEALIYLSIITRRLHDTGVGAWKGYFRPLFCWGLLWVIFSICGEQLLPNESALAAHQEMALAFYLCYILVGLFYLFYGIKTFISAAFFEEERNANAYGVPMFYEDCYKAKALTFASLYIVLFLIFAGIQIMLGFYLAVAMMFNGGAGGF